LGPVEISVNDTLLTPSAPKVCQVLGMLLFSANRVVELDALIEELWADRPPHSAVTTAQTYIYHLRKMLARHAAAGAQVPRLESRAPGYLLRIEPGQIDAVVFERLYRQGRSLLDEHRPEEAAQRLAQALALWRGPALANVCAGRLLEGQIAHLHELKIAALETRIAADMQLGRHRELICELRAIVAAHPLNEWFHAQLIFALSATGRRGEALDAYQDLRQLLDTDLGLEPSAELQRLQHQVLTGRPGAARGAVPVAPPPGPVPVTSVRSAV
jgi:DNA-binding SARP family transcriptional activator